MKGTDRIILVALPVVALAIGFWVLVLGPKQGEAGDLSKEAESLRSAIATSESEVAAAEQARASFPDYYADVVSLGTAVPEDDDQATFVQELSEMAREDSVSLRGFTLAADSAPEAAPAPAPTPPPAESTGEPTDTAAPVAAAPTEASAAALPLGATVGPAGLPVTPYDLKYFGRFFDMADLFASLDERVTVSEVADVPEVDGRLVTIDSFAMTADPVRGFPRVQTDLNITTYLVPAEQGIAAGANQAGPAPVPVAAAPATTPDPAVAPTASVTP